MNGFAQGRPQLHDIVHMTGKSQIEKLSDWTPGDRRIPLPLSGRLWLASPLDTRHPTPASVTSPTQGFKDWPVLHHTLSCTQTITGINYRDYRLYALAGSNPCEAFLLLSEVDTPWFSFNTV